MKTIKPLILAMSVALGSGSEPVVAQSNSPDSTRQPSILDGRKVSSGTKQPASPASSGQGGQKITVTRTLPPPAPVTTVTPVAPAPAQVAPVKPVLAPSVTAKTPESKPAAISSPGRMPSEKVADKVADKPVDKEPEKVVTTSSTATDESIGVEKNTSYISRLVGALQGAVNALFGESDTTLKADSPSLEQAASPVVAVSNSNSAPSATPVVEAVITPTAAPTPAPSPAPVNPAFIPMVEGGKPTEPVVVSQAPVKAEKPKEKTVAAPKQKDPSSVSAREGKALAGPDVDIPLATFRDKVDPNDIKTASVLDAFLKAKRNSPAYRAAEATRDANLTEATISKLAFVPQGNLGLTQSELEDSTRKVARASVPLFSLSALATYREAKPREVLAYANFRVQENALATDVFRVISGLVRAIELERLNQATIDTLEQQAKFADSALKEGQGTITDLRDTQVRLNQALANRISIVNQRFNAEQEYRNLVGELPPRKSLQMTAGFKDIQIQEGSSYLGRAMEGNPAYLAAKQQLLISDLTILKSKGAVAPTLSASAIVSERNGIRNDNIGLTVSIPISAPDYLGLSVAKDKNRAVQETFRGIEQDLRLLVQQLQSASASGRIEVAVRSDAIVAAELSVQANQKSFLGGVRTQIEVLNSLQVLFDTQMQQANARLNLAQNVLRLELESGAEPIDALGKVQALLF